MCFAGVFNATAQSLSLAGQWRFALDRKATGVSERWFSRDLADKIQLPGVLQSQGYGDEISTNTPWVLSLYDKLWFLREDYTNYTRPGAVKVPFVCQPPRHYLGAAWYQRDLEIPANWNEHHVVLFLERPHWETRVWVDDRLIGTNKLLCAPHEFELGIVVGQASSLPHAATTDLAGKMPAPLLKPGKHRLTVRVDNRLQFPSPAGQHAVDAHAVSDSLGSSWNGIVGKIELRSTPLVWIEDLKVYPNLSARSVKVKGIIGNASGQPGSDNLFVAADPDGETSKMNSTVEKVSWSTTGGSFEIEIPVRTWLKTWGEFDPSLSQCVARLSGNGASRSVRFGFRDFRADGNKFLINGRETYMRGTHHGGDFPLTGYPPMDVEYWRKLITTCKEWGLNSMRFHSFCPPDAAFTAADELGFYLYIEPGMWNEFSPGTGMEKMLYAETEAILKAYGNHPSFVMFSPSNEPKGRWREVLPQWAEHFRGVDARHLYTSGTGFTDSDAPGPMERVDFMATQRFGPARVRGESGWFGRDYSRSLQGVKVPVVTHEVGQWVAYPDYDIIKKFTGYMRPGNYEIFRDSAAEHGVLEKNKDFAFASGRFQLACYKEEIEANLRTPGLAGFQLLDLHDYVGQGTALVGLLDTFWDEKGYVTPDEFKKFCNTVVPLARLTKRVFTTTDSFEVPVEVANYNATDMTNATAGWEIRDASGKAVARGEFAAATIPVGKSFPLGKATAELSKLSAPEQCRLVVRIGQAFTNDWNFWLYPAEVLDVPRKAVSVTSSWDAAEAKLNSGGKVLFLPRNTDLAWDCPPLDVVPVFWNRLMNPAWGRMLGLWCDTNHPALAGFPTEANCDWQWTQITRGVRPVNLGKLPRGLQPIVSAIDDWNRNWKLGAIFEAKVGAGRLLVSSFDLSTDLDHRPVARQLRRSLLDYMAGEKFQPRTEISVAEFRSLHFDSRIMRQLGVRATSDGADATAAIDGDPNSIWIVGATQRGTKPSPHPHDLTITFPAPVTMSGIVLMPRQNDRDHLGDVRGYKLETSNDGTNWLSVARGELASMWNPQQINFGQTVTTKQLKFTARSGFGNDSSTALGELAVIYAGPKLAERKTGSMEYRRRRSTSTDVDEGVEAATARTNTIPRRP